MKRGMQLVDKFGAVRDLPLAIDQRRACPRLSPTRTRATVDSSFPFFGRLTSTYKSVGMLAMQKNASHHLRRRCAQPEARTRRCRRTPRVTRKVGGRTRWDTALISTMSSVRRTGRISQTRCSTSRHATAVVDREAWCAPLLSSISGCTGCGKVVRNMKGCAGISLNL